MKFTNVLRFLTFLILLVFYLAIVTSLITCSNHKKKHETASIVYEDLIKAKIQDIESWVLWCNNTASKERHDNHEFDMNGCDTGDAVLFNGLLCSSGSERACQAVKDAQNDEGQWFRSEFYKNNSTVNSFSRDMAKGVLLYLITTKDTDAAKKWLQYIENKGKLCTDDTDKRCSITPTTWALFAYTWKYIGLKETFMMKIGTVGDDTAQAVAAKTNPIGFQLHLIGVTMYLEILADQFGSEQDRQAVKILAERQPDNPFFQYLKDGPTNEVVQKTLDWCPSEEPKDKTQWSFERDTSQEPNKESMGHECIFLLQKFLN